MVPDTPFRRATRGVVLDAVTCEAADMAGVHLDWNGHHQHALGVFQHHPQVGGELERLGGQAEIGEGMVQHRRGGLLDEGIGFYRGLSCHKSHLV